MAQPSGAAQGKVPFHAHYQGTQESYWQARSVLREASDNRTMHFFAAGTRVAVMVLPLGFALGGLAWLVTDSLALLVMGVGGMLLFLPILMGVLVPAAIFTALLMGYLIRPTLVVGCLGRSVQDWPAWSLQEKETQLLARLYLRILLTKDAREVARALGENFTGTLAELRYASNRLSC